MARVYQFEIKGEAAPLIIVADDWRDAFTTVFNLNNVDAKDDKIVQCLCYSSTALGTFVSTD